MVLRVLLLGLVLVLDWFLFFFFKINPCKYFQTALSQTNLEVKECRCQTCMKPI